LLAIAAKAMSADREQRYESAAAMTDDLGRWLARRPVQAVGGGRVYAFRCLIRRNRIASLAATLVLAAILGGSAPRRSPNSAATTPRSCARSAGWTCWTESAARH
jgi:non-specific serine/threonine protein kinase/serine/threonine-protein kinase